MDLGIFQGAVADIEKAGTSVGFYPHGLGHHLGLEVHDVSPTPHPPMNFTAPSTQADIDARIEKLRQSRCEGLRVYSERASREHQAPVGPHYHDRTFEGGHTLQPGMVVTIEPGVYFNEFLLSEFFLNHPLHSKYINRTMLEKYMSVGGVRIEDDILITKNGNENLTMAPKGEQMLKIIRVAAGARRA